MGERALSHEPATERDRQIMSQVTFDAMRSGALGFSTSRSINHRASDGNPTPSLTATEAELTTIAQAVGRSGAGVLQMISDFSDPDQEMAMLGRVIKAGGRPASISLMQVHEAPDRWRDVLSWIGELNRDGQEVRGQVSNRLIGALLAFESSLNPFAQRPTHMAIASLPFEERISELRKPDVRRRILSEESVGTDRQGTSLVSQFEMMYPLGESPDYEPVPDQFVGAIAKARGVTPEEVTYDLMLENDGRAMLAIPATNYAGGSLDVCAEMMRNEFTVPGLGDGGAHVGFLCDASLPTHLLSYWTRDRTRGDRLALPEVVRSLAHDTARTVGMYDRGVIAPGLPGGVSGERLLPKYAFTAASMPLAPRPK